jgi:hypothetical protein
MALRIPIESQFNQGRLTEGEGLVRLTSLYELVQIDIGHIIYFLLNKPP